MCINTTAAALPGATVTSSLLSGSSGSGSSGSSGGSGSGGAADCAACSADALSAGTCAPGAYGLRYTATDSDGNTTSLLRRVVVEERAALSLQFTFSLLLPPLPAPPPSPQPPSPLPGLPPLPPLPGLPPRPPLQPPNPDGMIPPPQPPTPPSPSPPSPEPPAPEPPAPYPAPYPPPAGTANGSSTGVLPVDEGPLAALARAAAAAFAARLTGVAAAVAAAAVWDPALTESDAELRGQLAAAYLPQLGVALEAVRAVNITSVTVGGGGSQGRGVARAGLRASLHAPPPKPAVMHALLHMP